MTDNLVIIGGGVMGLFSAYHASERFDAVTVLERGRIGDPMTASFGRTRSYRCDYLDPALCWTGCKDTGRGAALGHLGYLAVTRPKSYHLKKVTA